MLKIAVGPVPKPLWNENLRHRLSPSAWRRVRQEVLAARGQRCESCGVEIAEAKRVSAHEEWRYDTTTRPAVAALVGIKLSCWLCHAVEHIGMTHELTISGAVPHALEAAIAHFCRLNGVGREVFEQHKDEAFVEWHRLNALEWRVDWGHYASMVNSSPGGTS